MFALVAFLADEHKGGTVPCEIIHYSWFMSDQLASSWPGSTGYFTAFKNSSPPRRNWKAERVIVKFVFDQLDLVRLKRDKFINNSEIETSMDEEVRKTYKDYL
ncbi:unnamed protein product [Allacma fusca]|uniref:Uncharacterized protein n=1 Tax=Allacma fusca TaxID=39272 RepID=A0A8J2JKT0_9HEXA|nr:unnamed protein product [Allacma fusca]